MACKRQRVFSPAVALGYTEHHDAKSYGGLVIVLEEAFVAAQHDAGVGPQALEVGCVCGVAAYQHHSRNLLGMVRVVSVMRGAFATWKPARNPLCCLHLFLVRTATRRTPERGWVDGGGRRGGGGVTGGDRGVESW